MNSYFILIISITVASFSQVLLKKGAEQHYTGFIRQYLNFYVITGYGLTFISLLLTALAYRGLEYKIGPLIESLGFIIVIFLSRLFFKEKITTKKIIGMTTIFLGIFIYYI